MIWMVLATTAADARDDAAYLLHLDRLDLLDDEVANNPIFLPQIGQGLVGLKTWVGPDQKTELFVGELLAEPSPAMGVRTEHQFLAIADWMDDPSRLFGFERISLAVDPVVVAGLLHPSYETDPYMNSTLHRIPNIPAAAYNAGQRSSQLDYFFFIVYQDEDVVGAMCRERHWNDSGQVAAYREHWVMFDNFSPPVAVGSGFQVLPDDHNTFSTVADFLERWDDEPIMFYESPHYRPGMLGSSF